MFKCLALALILAGVPATPLHAAVPDILQVVLRACEAPKGVVSEAENALVAQGWERIPRVQAADNIARVILLLNAKSEIDLVALQSWATKIADSKIWDNNRFYTSPQGAFLWLIIDLNGNDIGCRFTSRMNKRTDAFLEKIPACRSWVSANDENASIETWNCTQARAISGRERHDYVVRRLYDNFDARLSRLNEPIALIKIN